MPRHFYGWQPSPPDPRDYQFSPAPEVLAALPPRVDLSAQLGPVLNQGQLSSCGPNAAAGMLMAQQFQQHLPVVAQARLFLYYNTRMIMGTVGQDSGVCNRDLLKAMNRHGTCTEQLWPYVTSRYQQRPPQAAYDAAAAGKIL